MNFQFKQPFYTGILLYDEKQSKTQLCGREVHIFLNNIRSVSANLGHLELLVSELKPSVIALTETWFKSENDDELFSLEGYHQSFTNTRTQKRGGGKAIYVPLDLEAELFHSDEYY